MTHCKCDKPEFWKHLHLPFIQMGTPGLVWGVGCDAATSRHTPGISDDGQRRTLSQTVDHRLCQFCFLHRIFDFLQLLVIGPPAGSCCC